MTEAKDKKPIKRLNSQVPNKKEKKSLDKKAISSKSKPIVEV